MKLRYLIFFLSWLAVYKSSAQVATVASTLEYDSLKAYELRLQALSDSILDGSKPKVRSDAHRKFIPLLKKALKVRGSFNYPFDSLKFMKKLEPDDHSFRMFNWLLKFDDGSYHYVAAIQMNTKDSLHLIPLYDKADKLDDSSLELATFQPDNWFGALYYTIIQSKIKGRTYYLLLGWNGGNYITDKKVIEVLSFDKKGKLTLGAPIFDVAGKTKTRIVFQYSGDATMLLNYLPDNNVISFDHLVPANEKMAAKTYLYVPDGSYDYFIFKKKKWFFQDDLFKNLNKNIKEAGESNAPKRDDNGPARIPRRR
jgi:hypothetical protein